MALKAAPANYYPCPKCFNVEANNWCKQCERDYEKDKKEAYVAAAYHTYPSLLTYTEAIIDAAHGNRCFESTPVPGASTFTKEQIFVLNVCVLAASPDDKDRQYLIAKIVPSVLGLPKAKKALVKLESVQPNRYLLWNAGFRQRRQKFDEIMATKGFSEPPKAFFFKNAAFAQDERNVRRKICN